MNTPRSSMVAIALAASGYAGALGGCGTLVGSPQGGGKKGGAAAEPSPSAPSPAPPAAVAPVTFMLTDAPIDGIKSVFVTIEGVEVSADGVTWAEVPLQAATEIDLIQYSNGNTVALAALPQLPVGSYSQTRLKLSTVHPPRLIELGGAEYPLSLPSGSQDGVSVATAFAAIATQPLNLTIDFDLRKSIKLLDGTATATSTGTNTGTRNGKGNGNGNGNAGGDSLRLTAGTSGTGTSAPAKYQFTPTLRLINDDQAGSVVGKSVQGKLVCAYAKGSPKDATDAADHAETCAYVTNGQYTLPFVPQGEYELRIFNANGAPVDTPALGVKAGEKKDAGEND